MTPAAERPDHRRRALHDAGQRAPGAGRAGHLRAAGAGRARRAARPGQPHRRSPGCSASGRRRSPPTLDRLRDLALVWGRDSALRLVLTVRDTVGPFPAGLGPPSPSAPEPAEVDALLAEAPDGVRDVLDRLVWQSPVGACRNADRPVSRTTARSPGGVAAGAPAADRAGPGPRRAAPRGRPAPARRTGAPRRPAGAAARSRRPSGPAALVDAAAGGAASELLRLVGELGELWGLTPPPVLRSGGLGVRDLRRTATALDLPEPTAAVVIELAYAAGLVADDGQVGASWAPTPAYDAWTSEPPAGALAAARPGLADAPRGCPSWSASGTSAAPSGPRCPRTWTGAPAAAVRQSVLAVLAELPPGAARRTWTPCWPAALAAAAAHRRAGRAAGALDPAGGRAARGDRPRGAQRGRARAADRRAATPARERWSRALLPAPVDHVLLQADLTAVAPGPLEVELGRLMHLAGGRRVPRRRDRVPVHRRTACAAPWTAAGPRTQLLAELGEASRTPVPQPLEYLVRDVARRHGRIRVGAARVLRAQRRRERPARADGRPAGGAAAAAGAGTERAGGAGRAGDRAAGAARRWGWRRRPSRRPARSWCVVRTPAAPRPRQPPAPTRGEVAPAADPLLQAVVRALRSRRRRPRRRPAGPPLAPTEPTHTLAVLREAIERRQRVWIGYADGDGPGGAPGRRAAERRGWPGHRVRPHPRGGASFSVHRVTGVAPAAVGESDEAGRSGPRSLGLASCLTRRRPAPAEGSLRRRQPVRRA